MNAAGLASKVPDGHSEDVLAILVTTDEARVLRTLRSLVDGHRRPDRVIISSSRHLNEDALGAILGQIPFSVEVSSAANISQAINAIAAGDSIEEPWVWILHDDSFPEPSCLDELMHVAVRSEKIGALGPKQVSSSDQRYLLEVGIDATSTGRRVPQVDEREIDQGQLDNRSDVLAVGSAGMLVRTQAGRAVGWFDPALGPFGEGLELSRRMWMGGWRVAVVPRAVIAHEQRSHTGRHSFAARRSAQMYNAVLAAPPFLALLSFLFYVLLGPFRALARLVMKDSVLAGQEIGASARLASMLGKIRRGRRRIAAAKMVGSGVFDTLESRAKDVRRARSDVRKARREAQILAHRPDPITVKERLARKRSTRRYALAIGLLTLLLALASSVDLLGSQLSGGAALPDGSSAKDLWVLAQRSWLPTGDGLPAPLDPLWLLLSPFVAVFGTLGEFTTFLTILAMPLAALSAFYGVRCLTISPQMRAIAGLAWACAPPLLAAASYGYTAPILWHILAPLALRALFAARRRSTSALGAFAILGAYMTACAPLTFVFLLIAALFAGRKGARLRWAWAPIPALASMLPLLVAGIRGRAGWNALFAMPGRAPYVTPNAEGLLSFSPDSPIFLSRLWDEKTTLLPAAVMLVVAFVCLLARGRSYRLICAGWAMAALGWAWAAMSVTREVSTVIVDSSIQPVNAWSGVALSFGWLGLVVAVVAGGNGLRADLRSRSFGWRHLASGVLVVASVAAPVVACAGWAYEHSADGDQRVLAKGDEVIPAISRAQAQSSARERTLVLSATEGSIHAAIWREEPAQLHELSSLRGVLSDSAADADLTAAVASLAGDSRGFASVIARHAIGVVLVDGPDTRERRILVAQINSAANLAYVTETAAGAFWRNELASARIVVEDGQGTTSLPSGIVGAKADVSDGVAPRTLRLAERADSRWSASLNGEELKPVGGSWNQQWQLGGTGGTLVIDYDRTLSLALLGFQAFIGFTAIIVALPSPRRRRK